MIMRLTQREKILALTLVVFIIVWALSVFVVKPAIARAETLNRVIYEKKDDLGKLFIKSKEYVLLRDDLDDLQKKIAQQQEFKLLPCLESLIQQHNLDKKVVTMKQYTLPLEQNYQEIIVEIKLENLTLSQLINFMWKSESLSALTKIRTLHIKRNLTDENLLDATVEIHTIKLSQNKNSLD
jgi:hypothetical protein